MPPKTKPPPALNISSADLADSDSDDEDFQPTLSPPNRGQKRKLPPSHDDQPHTKYARTDAEDEEDKLTRQAKERAEAEDVMRSFMQVEEEAKAEREGRIAPGRKEADGKEELVEVRRPRNFAGDVIYETVRLPRTHPDAIKYIATALSTKHTLHSAAPAQNGISPAAIDPTLPVPNVSGGPIESESGFTAPPTGVMDLIGEGVAGSEPLVPDGEHAESDIGGIESRSAADASNGIVPELAEATDEPNSSLSAMTTSTTMKSSATIPHTPTTLSTSRPISNNSASSSSSPAVTQSTNPSPSTSTSSSSASSALKPKTSHPPIRRKPRQSLEAMSAALLDPGPKKMGTVEKSKLDWQSHTTTSLPTSLADELAANRKPGGGSYLEKEAFLKRVEGRRGEGGSGSGVGGSVHRAAR